MPHWEHRFWEKVDVRGEDECWEWQAACNSRGYGHLWLSGKPAYAHRLSWRLEHGPIPDGMFICHHCDNPLCCNPQHLFIGTPADNAQDRDRKGHTHIPQNVMPGKPKLTACQVRRIRHLYSTNGYSQTGLARLFRVGRTTIRKIVHRTTWAWLD